MATLWRGTVLPLFNRTMKAMSAWLAPGWDNGLELRGDLDQIEALPIEREALWARLQATSFLTDDEKRAAIGYGPMPVEAIETPTSAPEPMEQGTSPFDDTAGKYWADQPRVPAGNSDGGQWTGGGGPNLDLSDSEAAQARFTRLADSRNEGSVYDTEDTAYHKYSRTSTVCRAELKCTKEQMVDQLSRFAVPGQDPSRPVISGFMYGVSDPRSGLPAGYVTSTVSDDGLTVVNKTTPLHLLHEGTVTRQVREESDGSWSVTTTGVGVNFNRLLAQINEDQGPKIFEELDNQMRQNIEERGHGFKKNSSAHGDDAFIGDLYGSLGA